MSNKYKYASVNEAPVYESVINDEGKKIINRILMGTYVKIIKEEVNWYKVRTAGPDGWMQKNLLSDVMGLKVFYLDVGQGDSVLIEIGKYKILIDGGPDNSMYNYLTKYQYKYLLENNKKVKIDYMFISHFDMDHYKGYIKLLGNQGFEFVNICHPGILKFASKGNPYNTGLGNTIKMNSKIYLTKIFNNLLNVNEPASFNRDVKNFMNVLTAANNQGRVKKVIRIGAGDIIIKEKIDGIDFKLEILAPFTEKAGNKNAFIYWEDEGKTINGHSLIIKITYGKKTFLFGGDLNTLSENYLMEKYKNKNKNPFEVDVAKSCHHGSSDFSEKFMNLVNPYATVISSGDNESFSHPRADAIGCAGKYSKSKRPLVYSTELARSTNLKKGKILYGMINARCNGNDIYISQMKEARNNRDLWDSYLVK
jgi:competence protein ComEC